MVSAKQLLANRANAQRSTGPRTESGKRRSSLNAFRHGLTGQVAVMPEEDIAAFNEFAKGIVASLKPADAHERQLAHSYASFQWRINRVASIEDTMFTLGVMEAIAENLNIEHPEAHNAVSNAKTFRDDSEAFARLSLYSQRLLNQAQKALKQLKEIQAERRQQNESQTAEVVTAAAATTSQPNGFVCSTLRTTPPAGCQQPANPAAQDVSHRAAASDTLRAHHSLQP